MHKTDLKIERIDQETLSRLCPSMMACDEQALAWTRRQPQPARTPGSLFLAGCLTDLPAADAMSELITVMNRTQKNEELIRMYKDG